MEFFVDKGWISQAKKVPSPNFGPRPSACAVDLLIVHNISLPPGQFEGDCVERFFCNQLDWGEHPYFSEIRGMEVSSHLYIRRNGELIQFVSCDDRAWHAGRSSYCGREECNDYSIGIELEGTDDTRYENEQYRVLADVTTALLKEYPAMDSSRIVGHSDVSPGRKTDPGPAFDWQRYLSLLRTVGEQK